CGQAQGELAEPFRGRVSSQPVADWLTTAYPSVEDLAELRKQAAEVSTVRDRLREAEKMFHRWTKLKGQETPLRQGLARLQNGLPADRPGGRRRHAHLEAEDQALHKNLAARRAEVQDTQKDLDRLAREREQTQKLVVEVNGKLQTEEATRQHCRQTLDR